jgi:hypothetical protein
MLYKKIVTMKYALIALFIIINPVHILAQKNSLFADAGIAFSTHQPGVSATYNYKLGRWLAIGIGAQGYGLYPTIANIRQQFVPAVFADIRANIRARRVNQFFTFLDIGMDFYNHNSEYIDKYIRKENTIYDVPKNNGVYTGFGIGYFRKMTKRGWGPYASFKIVMNYCNVNTYDTRFQEQEPTTWGRGTWVASLGFRF